MVYFFDSHFSVTDLDLDFYRPQAKFAKVMFLQVSVCLSTGEPAWWRWVCVAGGHVWQGAHARWGLAWRGGMCGRGGMHGSGVCVTGGVCGRWVCMAGGHAWQGGLYMAGGCVWQGACMPHMPPWQILQQWHTVNERAVRILL